MAAISGSSITFQSRDTLQQALEPLSIEEVTSRIAASKASIRPDFEYDENLTNRTIIPLRNLTTGNLLKTEVFHTKALSVFYPETPRVPHHLSIALNRKGIKGIADISEEENAEIFGTIKKIAEIYKTISIKGFVITQYDKAQPGHLDRYVIEVIPHLPGFQGIKNIVDKIDCNRHVLFRSANISPISNEISSGEIERQAAFWNAAFQQESAPLDESEIKVSFPYIRHESHQLEAEKILYQQLIQLLQDRGGHSAKETFFEEKMPLDIPEIVNSVTVENCVFCSESTVKRQLVYQYGDVEVFYNMRKGSKAGTSFLILPKRHIEKVYGLTPQEIKDIYLVRKALVDVLNETHPECEVIAYTQDDPAVGQTVFHSHEQVVAVDPKSIAFTWTMLTLYPSSNVSAEEMLQVREEFGLKLHQKMMEFTTQKKAA